LCLLSLLEWFDDTFLWNIAECKLKASLLDSVEEVHHVWWGNASVWENGSLNDKHLIHYHVVKVELPLKLGQHNPNSQGQLDQRDCGKNPTENVPNVLHLVKDYDNDPKL
jgi:hypothetical protein